MSTPTTDDAAFEAWRQARTDAIAKKWRDESRVKFEKSKQTAAPKTPVSPAENPELEALRAKFHDYIRITNANVAYDCDKYFSLQRENNALRAELAAEKEKNDNNERIQEIERRCNTPGTDEYRAERFWKSVIARNQSRLNRGC